VCEEFSFVLGATENESNKHRTESNRISIVYIKYITTDIQKNYFPNQHLSLDESVIMEEELEFSPVYS